jgi:hypothetical protein
MDNNEREKLTLSAEEFDPHGMSPMRLDIEMVEPDIA